MLKRVQTEDDQMDPQLQAYYQGMADYEAQLCACAMSPEEAAYHQGMADYEAALTDPTQQDYDTLAMHNAYYQGMADYEAALTGQLGMDPSEAAYYQGMADAEAAYAALG
jgi:hypothetical protein